MFTPPTPPLPPWFSIFHFLSIDKGGGGGSSAKTGLIVFVVLLIVALIGTVIAIVILAWMVREMQSEREGKGGTYDTMLIC